MKVCALNHFNITGTKALIEKCLGFYCGVLGLTIGWRPNFNRPGYWLYSENEPILHLTETGTDERGRSNLNHIALTCQSIETLIPKLEKSNIDHSFKYISELNQTQVFLQDPADINIELNFKGKHQIVASHL